MQRQVDSSVRRSIATALGTLGDEINTVYELASLLKNSDNANSIYSALWKICQRMKVRVYITDEQGGQHIEVVPMEDRPSFEG